MHRRLGDPVQVDQARRFRVVVQPRPKSLWFQCFAGEQHSLKLQLMSQFGFQRVGGLQCIERRRRAAQDGDVFGHQQGVEVLGRAGDRLGHHHQPSAAEQRTPHLPHRDVERQGMALRPRARAQHIGIQ